MFSVWLVFTSNMNSQTTWLKVKLKLVNLFGRYSYVSFLDTGQITPTKSAQRRRYVHLKPT